MAIKYRLNTLSPYSKINILLIVYGNTQVDKEEVKRVINLCFDSLLARNILNSVQVSTLYLHESTTKSKSNIHFDNGSLYSLLQCYLEKGLHLSVSNGKLINHESVATQYKFSDILKYTLNEMHEFLQYNLKTHFSDAFETTFQNMISSNAIDDDAHLIQVLSNEIQVLNFWLLALKQLLIPLRLALGQCSEYVCLNSTS